MKAAKMILIFSVSLLLFTVCSSSKTETEFLRSGSPVPLIQAHAHNDYKHNQPLFDALSHGFCSIEADIFLKEGSLFVAHSLNEIQDDKTLQSLYLDPLQKIINQNSGNVYPDGTGIILLIDIKTESDTTYNVLREILSGYKDFLTTYENGKVDKKAVTVIISGSRAVDLIKNESVRYAAIDGRPSDLENDADPYFYPLISESWLTTAGLFGYLFNTEGAWRNAEELVLKAHENGNLIRFWMTPDNPAFWLRLKTIGVDLINTDNLFGLEEFLIAEDYYN